MITDEASNLSSTQHEDSNGSVEKISSDGQIQIDNHDGNANNNDLIHENENEKLFQRSPIGNLNKDDQNIPSSSITQRELENIRISYENKLKQQQLESTRKENILIMRLTLKEQELQECLAQIEALKNSKSPSNYQLESYFVDPALNYIFEKMKKEVDTAKSRVEEMQNEMNAWKFTSDSITGKQLMSKCRQLHQENEELGKMISSGKIAKLESGLAMHKNYSETLNKSQADFEEVLNEIEENAEGFQNTVYYLQQQLKELKEKYQKMEQILKHCKCECKNELITTSDDNVCDSSL